MQVEFNKTRMFAMGWLRFERGRFGITMEIPGERVGTSGRLGNLSVRHVQQSKAKQMHVTCNKP